MFDIWKIWNGSVYCPKKHREFFKNISEIFHEIFHAKKVMKHEFYITVPHAITMSYPWCEMVGQDHQYRDQRDNKTATSAFSYCKPESLNLWPHFSSTKEYSCFASTACTRLSKRLLGSLLLYDWKRPPGRPWKNWLQQIEDTGLPVSAWQLAKSGPLIVEIATTLSWSRAALNQWVTYRIV